MDQTVSIPALKQYLQTAADLGVNWESLLAARGVDPSDIEDNNRRITLTEFEAIVEELIRSSGHPFFGLHASRFVSPTTYVSLGLMILSAESLRDTIALLPAYEALVGAMGVSSLTEQGSEVLLQWDCALESPLVRRHVIDTVMSSWYRFGKDIVGLEGSLVAVYLEHEELGETAPYEKIFRCPVHYRQSVNGLLLPAAALDQKQPQADPVLLEALLRHADTALDSLQLPQHVSQLVVAQLRAMLPEGTPGKAEVAARLGMSARTLQRRLAEEGSSYHALLNRVRMDRAKQLLAGPMSMADIASALGFAETRSFHRRFKQWTGITAGAYRNAQGSDASDH